MAPLVLPTGPPSGIVRASHGLQEGPSARGSERRGGLIPAPAPLPGWLVCVRSPCVHLCVRLCVWAGLLQPPGALVLGLGEGAPAPPPRPAPLQAAGVGVGEGEGWMGLEDIKETQKLPVRSRLPVIQSLS